MKLVGIDGKVTDVYVPKDKATGNKNYDKARASVGFAFGVPSASVPIEPAMAQHFEKELAAGNDIDVNLGVQLDCRPQVIKIGGNEFASNELTARVHGLKLKKAA